MSYISKFIKHESMSWIQMIRISSAFGAIFAAVSELWFWQVPLDFSLVTLWGVYSLLGFAFWLLFIRYQINALAGVVVAGGVFGFLAEGAVVGQLYAAVPFSIVWTPLAWHMLITVIIGWYYYRVSMAAPLYRFAGYNATLGLGVGIWGAYLWNVVESTDGSISYVWHAPSEFALQCVIGYGLFVYGHWSLSRYSTQYKAVPVSYYWLVGVCLIVFYTAQLIAGFPFSLLLLPLLLLSIVTMYRRSCSITQGEAPLTPSVTSTSFTFAHLLVSAVLPLIAIGTYSVWHQLQFEWETNVWVAFITVPIALGWWLRSLFQLSFSQ